MLSKHLVYDALLIHPTRLVEAAVVVLATKDLVSRPAVAGDPPPQVAEATWATLRVAPVMVFRRDDPPLETKRRLRRFPQFSLGVYGFLQSELD